MKTWPVVAAILVVGAGIIAAIILSRPGPVPEPVIAATASPEQAVSSSPEPTPRYSPTPEPLPSPSSPSATATAPAVTNLNLFSAQIHRHIREMFDELMCGYPPTSAELEDWTDYVVRIGNRLQPELSWEIALAEAEARAYEALYNSPEAEFFRDAPQC